MKYKDAIKQSMEMLAEDKKTIFIGYNNLYGSQAYGTFTDIPLEQRVETPVAESLMAGLATGMSLRGYRSVIYFERHDFVLNALDVIVNHIDKLDSMSKGEFKTPVIMRAIVGGIKPFYPGVQHTQDFTKAFKELIELSIYEPKSANEVIKMYKEIDKITREDKKPVMVIEHKDLYETI